MDNITIPQRDKGFNLAFTVNDSDGDAYTITGYTIKLKVWEEGIPGTLIVDGTCDIDDGSVGTCHYTVAEDDFNDIAAYIAELELTQSGIIESTESFRITIVESGYTEDD